MGQLTPGGNIPSFEIAGVTFPAKYSGLKLLVSYPAGSGYSCFRQVGSATDYVVPASKTFKAIGCAMNDTAATNIGVGLGYADTAATFGGGAAPTTPIFSIGGGSTARRNVLFASLGRVEVNMLGWSIPTGKYPFAYEDGATEATVYLWGYEE